MRAKRAPPTGVRIARAELLGVPLLVVSLPAGLPPCIEKELTAAECEVAKALVAGDSYATIAARRGTRQRTIANQVRTIFGKLGVSTRSELLRKVMSRG